MVNYRVEFKEKKKYNPATRSVIVEVKDGATNPLGLFSQEYSLKQHEVLNVTLVQEEKVVTVTEEVLV